MFLRVFPEEKEVWASGIGGKIRHPCWKQNPTSFCDYYTQQKAGEGKFTFFRGCPTLPWGELQRFPGLWYLQHPLHWSQTGIQLQTEYCAISQAPVSQAFRYGPSNATVLIAGDPFVRTSLSEPREPALLNILPPSPGPLPNRYSICPSGELYQLTVIEKNFTCFSQNPSCCKFISSSFEINLLSTAHLCTPAPNHTHIRKDKQFPLWPDSFTQWNVLPFWIQPWMHIA